MQTYTHTRTNNTHTRTHNTHTRTHTCTYTPTLATCTMSLAFTRAANSGRGTDGSLNPLYHTSERNVNRGFPSSKWSSHSRASKNSCSLLFSGFAKPKHKTVVRCVSQPKPVPHKSTPLHSALTLSPLRDILVALRCIVFGCWNSATATASCEKWQ